MKRDMELVRQVVLAIQDHDPNGVPLNLAFDGFDEGIVGHHVYLLMEAGFVGGHDVTSMGDPLPISLPVRLT